MGDRWFGQLARGLGRRPVGESGEPVANCDVPADAGAADLLRRALLEQAQVLSAPSDEQARTHANEARRLYEMVRDRRERQQVAREFEAAIRERPGWYYDPADGPM